MHVESEHVARVPAAALQPVEIAPRSRLQLRAAVEQSARMPVLAFRHRLLQRPQAVAQRERGGRQRKPVETGR